MVLPDSVVTIFQNLLYNTRSNNETSIFQVKWLMIIAKNAEVLQDFYSERDHQILSLV